MPRIEGPVASGERHPGNASEARHDARANECEFKVEMRSARRDFGAIGIAIAPPRIARITAHQVGYKDACDARPMNHQAEQIARVVTAKWDSRAIAAEAPGRQADKGHVGRNRAVTRNDP